MGVRVRVRMPLRRLCRGRLWLDGSGFSDRVRHPDAKETGVPVSALANKNGVKLHCMTMYIIVYQTPWTGVTVAADRRIRKKAPWRLPRTILLDRESETI